MAKKTTYHYACTNCGAVASVKVDHILHDDYAETKIYKCTQCPWQHAPGDLVNMEEKF